ncbi:MAG: hypothetical protein M3P04_07950 [Actinomycetota bacterium]|nr:hypothetical protein [Actinomycetota bacterium]
MGLLKPQRDVSVATSTSRPPGRVTLVDVDLCLPTPAAPSRCHVTATAARDLSSPVVLVVDSPSNPGISAHLVFDHVVCAVRGLLPDGCEEPVWIHRWGARALASVILCEERITRDHLMQRSTDGWESWPIPGRLTHVLLG